MKLSKIFNVFSSGKKLHVSWLIPIGHLSEINLILSPQIIQGAYDTYRLLPAHRLIALRHFQVA